jgi:hypothetical protein
VSVWALLASLAGIQETALTYPSTGARPKTRRMLTDQNNAQRTLAALFGLARWASGLLRTRANRTVRCR